MNAKPLNIVIAAVVGGIAGGFQLGWLYSLALGAGVGLLWLSVDLYRAKRRAAS